MFAFRRALVVEVRVPDEAMPDELVPEEPVPVEDPDDPPLHISTMRKDATARTESRRHP